MSAEDAARVAEWWEAILREPSSLPPGLELVHARPVRSVGRAGLPSGRVAFVKCMGFPRLRHRLRYLIRALPAAHEARVLRHLAAHGLRVPEVIAAGVQRRFGLPHASMLVTEGMPVIDAPLDPVAVIDLACGLRDAGVFHPDLHSDNFLALEGGGCAVLDMQSARLRARVTEDDFLAMLATLVSHLEYRKVPLEPYWVALRARGFDRREELERAALARNLAAFRRVYGRCLEDGSEFARSGGLARVVHVRRAVAARGEWVEGGPEMVRYWMGDRAVELLDDAEPILTALDRPRLGSRYRLRLVGGAEALARASAKLLDGFARGEERSSIRV